MAKTDNSTKNSTAMTDPKPVATEHHEQGLAFGKIHYNILLVSLAAIAGGLFIMTLDKEEFGFGFLGLTLGPIILFIGFMIPFVAILRKK
jgi:hypothetical protein